MSFCKSIFIHLVFIGLLSSSLVSCYRMPTEDDFSVVPTTNNPSVTYEKNDGLLSGLGS